MYDLLIKNGMVIDGSGKEAFPADIAISNGKIARLAPSIDDEARETIDAKGKTVTPGFIDIHRHADVNLFTESFGEPELHQGLTTIINGNCGLSVVPCPKKYRDEIFPMLQSVIGTVPEDEDKYFETFEEYIDVVKRTKLPLNVGMDIGNGTTRAASNGYTPGKLSKEAMERAKSYLRTSLEAGALAVTLGIIYSPENCYDKDDFVEVLSPMKDFDVPLVTHIRGEGDIFLESLEEVIYIAKKLGVRLHVSHFKCIGERNWGHVTRKARALLDSARENGLEVTCDVYPYRAGSTQLIQVLPPEFLEGGSEGICKRLAIREERDKLTQILKTPSTEFENLVSSIGWDNIVMATLTKEHNQKYMGKTVTEIAKMQGKDPYECAYDMLIDENCKISMIDYIVSEDDIKENLQYPYSAVISDSVYPTGGKWHPRLFGTFTKIIETYVLKDHIFSLEEAVRKMTYFPASVYKLEGKGLIKEGYDADINIFVPENIKSPASFEDPHQLSSGFDYVIIAGNKALVDDKLTGIKVGKVITK